VSELRRGTLYGVAAYLLWGLFPLYWPLLKPASAGEILAHRILWSLVVVICFLALRRKIGRIRQLRGRQLGLLAVAALLIAVNWMTYIWAVNHDHVVETSLGYFINPLVTIVLGVVVLSERLRPVQWAAVAIAAVAVAVLTIDYGRLPWIALTLALTFGTYGLLKKKAHVAADESMAIETLVLTLPALGFVLVLAGQGSATFGDHGLSHAALLAVTGFVSVVPLLCFGAAAIRVPLTSMGLLQYLAPVLQFLIGVLVFREAMPPSRWVGFAMVWLALMVLAVESVHARSRASSRAAALRAGPKAALDPEPAATH
jgi:chloramphenicol-sensitive protein RarD